MQNPPPDTKPLPMSERRWEKIKRTAQNRQQGLIVIMEDVYNPYNLNAIARSCDAFGVQNLHIIFEQQEPFDPRQEGRHSGVSAQKWVDYTIHDEGVTEALTRLKAEGWHIVATVADKRAVPLETVDFTQHPRLAVLMGNEHRGLSKEAVELADTLITIPMMGMIESFNVSVASAIMLYEVTRQRRETGNLLRLPDDEAEVLMHSLAKRATRAK